MRLTERNVFTLKAPRKGRVEYGDQECPGLVVRVTDSGHRSYMLRVRLGGRGPVRLLVGRVGSMTLDEARERARDALRAARDGGDVHGALRPRERLRVPVLGLEARDWLARVVDEQRQGAATRRVVKRTWLPLWENRMLDSVTRAEVVLFLEDTAATRGKTSAHVAFSTLRRFMNWCVARDVLERSPCEGVRPATLIGRRGTRLRVLNDEELKALWRATAKLSDRWRVFYRLVLFTGCRREEVRCMRWREMFGSVWTIPAERYKTGADHIVPLPGAAMAELALLPRSGEFVFGGARAVVNSAASKRQLDNVVENFCIHDLRRTMRTRLSELGVPWEVAELCIGHALPGLSRIYDRSNRLGERRAALEKWASWLGGLDVAPRGIATVATPAGTRSAWCRSGTKNHPR